MSGSGPKKRTSGEKSDKGLWARLSGAEQRAYIANLRATADDVEAGLVTGRRQTDVAASWAGQPKAVQQAFAAALRREANKLEQET